MSVILETSKGDIVLDLFVDECPKTVQNFLKYVYGPVESVEGIFLCSFSFLPPFDAVFADM